MKNNSQAGFTLVETLIALGVVSLIMTILTISMTSSAAALEKSKDRALFGIKLLRADSLIRDRIGAVAVPYWELPVLEAGESSVRISWYQGERNGYIRLLTEKDALIMETEDKRKKERIVLISGLDGTNLSILRDEQHIPYGIDVIYLHRQKTYHTMSAFSTSSLIRGLP
ncbi:PulJ/GspJ family protein [Treponema primitia]|uniref:PulJ/GspJ family protein n=1 Tax=Treponema primitia TaxID=88058 RepID=UPI00025555C0|nr:type II secretion system protein [Treponema primitia]